VNSGSQKKIDFFFTIETETSHLVEPLSSLRGQLAFEKGPNFPTEEPYFFEVSSNLQKSGVSSESGKSALFFEQSLPEKPYFSGKDPYVE